MELRVPKSIFCVAETAIKSPSERIRYENNCSGRRGRGFKSRRLDHFGCLQMALLSRLWAFIFPENRICTLFVLYFENYAPNFKALVIASETFALEFSNK